MFSVECAVLPCHGGKSLQDYQFADSFGGDIFFQYQVLVFSPIYFLVLEIIYEPLLSNSL